MCGTSWATPQTTAAGFNVFSFTTLQTDQDIQGAIAAGTSITDNSDVGASLPANYSGYAVVSGAGITSGSFVQVQNGNAYVPNGVAGSNPSTANIHFNGSGSLTTSGTSPVDFAGAKSYYLTLSSNLANDAAAITPVSFNGSLTANAPITIFNLTAAEYATLTSITTNGDTVFVNVAGTSVGMNQSMTVNGKQNLNSVNGPNDVMFNFYQNSGTVTIGNSLGGSVLAPLANVTVDATFNSTIVANSVYDVNGQIDAGDLFGGSTPPYKVPTTTPEPADLAVFGLLPLVWVGGRKRA